MAAVRVVLFTGKGGVGKTTVAAASAILAARSGRKILVISADPAHSLADALGARLGPEPSEVDTGVYAVQVNAQLRMERAWAPMRGHLLDVLTAEAKISDLHAEEMAVLPGVEEIFTLLEVRDQAASGRFGAILVDCAPTAETLRLLALPEALSWYMERIFPTHHRVMRSIRPLLGRRTAPLPGDAVFAAVSRLHGELSSVRDLLAAPETSVRLVLTPESVVIAEARRTLTSLAMYGYQVDSVVANRIFPLGQGGWLEGWAQDQRHRLEEVRQSFAQPLRCAAYRPGEPVGTAALLELAEELYGQDDPLEATAGADQMRVERDGEEFSLLVNLPLADVEDVTVARVGDELVLTIGGRRRVIALPSVLRRCTVGSARLSDGTLRVRFSPDPAQWPTKWGTVTR